MSTEIQALLSELIQTSEDELGIIQDLLKSSSTREISDTQEDLALEAVRSSMQATLNVMKAARAAFK